MSVFPWSENILLVWKSGPPGREMTVLLGQKGATLVLMTLPFLWSISRLVVPLLDPGRPEVPGVGQTYARARLRLSMDVGTIAVLGGAGGAAG